MKTSKLSSNKDCLDHQKASLEIDTMLLQLEWMALNLRPHLHLKPHLRQRLRPRLLLNLKQLLKMHPPKKERNANGGYSETDLDKWEGLKRDLKRQRRESSKESVAESRTQRLDLRRETSAETPQSRRLTPTQLEPAKERSVSGSETTRSSLATWSSWSCLTKSQSQLAVLLEKGLTELTGKCKRLEIELVKLLSQTQLQLQLQNQHQLLQQKRK